MTITDSVAAARGRAPLDLLISGARLVNVYTQEIYPAEIGIAGGVIVAVEPPGAGPRWQARQVIEARGKFALPGLVDTHVHIESSMMTPAGFAEAVLPLGTTTIVTDPHEIGNVLGLRGVRYMLEATRHLPLRVYFQAPSSVPSVPGVETAGAEFLGAEIAELLSWERVIGVAEVMDYVGVIEQSERMRQVLGAARAANTVISGHCPALTGRDLAAYLVAGPDSDHEGRQPAELLEKLRQGMYVEGRVSSFSESMSVLGEVCARLGSVPPNLVLCTDDIYPDDLLRCGHMDEVVRKGIAAGLPPLGVLRAASWSGAQRHRLHQLGAVAPGKWADIVLAADLQNFRADEVICRGQLVAAGGQMLAPLPGGDAVLEAENTVHLARLPSAQDFRLAARPGREQERVAVLAVGAGLRRSLEERTFPVKDGALDLSADEDICLLSVLERHGHGGRQSIVPVRGLGLRHGAAATTVSHDCHNLLVIGRDPADMALAARSLAECGGGICSVAGGAVQALLPLPVAGLMSPARAPELAGQLAALNQALSGQGVLQQRPLTGLLSLALPVIPDYGVTDYGLVEVSTQALVPLFR